MGRLTIDPVVFARGKPSRQAEILWELVGLELARFDTRRAEFSAERAAGNKRATSLRAWGSKRGRATSGAEQVAAGTGAAIIAVSKTMELQPSCSG